MGYLAGHRSYLFFRLIRLLNNKKKLKKIKKTCQENQ